MSDISKIVLPDGSTPNVKDSTARSQIKTVADDGGAKNLCTTNSVTYTAPAGYMAAITVNLPAGTYVLSFTYTTTGGSAVEYTVDGTPTTKYFSADTNRRLDYTITATTAFTSFRFYINADMTVSNIMVCTKAQWDISHDYQPYALSNADLTTAISLVKTAAVTLEQYGGGINLLENTREVGTVTEANISIVTNSDKTVTLTRTISASSNAFITINNSQYLDAGTYVLTGCPAGGSGSSYELRFLTPDGQAYIEDKGSGAEFTLSTGGTITACTIRIDKTYNPSGMTFKPMILRKSDYDRGYRDYQPYAHSNTTLTTAVSETYDRCCSKNLAQINSATFTSSSSNNRYLLIPVDGGQKDVILSIDSLTSDYSSSEICAIVFEDASHNTLLSTAVKKGSNITTDYSFSAPMAYAKLYPADNWEHSLNYTLNMSNFMICSKADWDISHDYVPYNTLNGTTLPMAVKELSDADGQKNLIIEEFTPDSNFVLNSDGSITVTYNNSSSSEYVTKVIAYASTMNLPNGTYVFSGCPNTSDADVKYRMDVTRANGGSALSDVGNGVQFVVGDGYPPVQFRIVIYPNQSVSNVTFKPMICTKAQWDISHEYQPYALPNVKLTPALVECVDNGKKNVLNTKGATITPASGVTVTRNSDGTFNVSRSTSGSVSNNYVLVYINAGSYMLSGAPVGGSNEQWIMDIRTNESESVVVGGQDSGNGAKITIPTSDYYRLTFRLGSSYSGTQTFKPMLCDESFWDVSQKYVPYAMDNAELTDKIAFASDNITTYRFTSATTRTITFSRYNYQGFIVFGFVQGVGVVFWVCNVNSAGVMSVKDMLTGNDVTQSTLTYTNNGVTGTLTITSTEANRWSYLTIIKNAEIN